MTVMCIKHSDQISIALGLVHQFHAMQVDKLGEPYINHVLTVAQHVAPYGEDYVTTALLHDIIEDTPVTVQYLLDHGVKPNIVSAVDVLTRKTWIPPQQYYNSIKQNELAYMVKLADINHNLSEKRFTQLPTPIQERLLKKYDYALQQLVRI